MANVKVFVDKQTDKHTDGWTDRPTDGQKLYAPDLSMRGHNNKMLAWSKENKPISF